jgi:hypothetical protein
VRGVSTMSTKTRHDVCPDCDHPTPPAEAFEDGRCVACALVHHGSLPWPCEVCGTEVEVRVLVERVVCVRCDGARDD